MRTTRQEHGERGRRRKPTRIMRVVVKGRSIRASLGRFPRRRAVSRARPPISGISVISGDDVRNKILKRAKRQKRSDMKGVDGEDVVTITLYRNGFVVGDGPFRSNQDAASKVFLNALSRGEIPLELESGKHKNKTVQLNDKHAEDYVPPSYVAFGGSGRTLSRGKGTSSGNATARTRLDRDEAKKIETNSDLPVVRVQLQLHNRRRVVVACHDSTTVRELWQHAAAETPDLDGRFDLLRGYPPKPFTDTEMNASIGKAGLAGARVMQRPW